MNFICEWWGRFGDVSSKIHLEKSTRFLLYNCFSPWVCCLTSGSQKYSSQLMACCPIFLETVTVIRVGDLVNASDCGLLVHYGQDQNQICSDEPKPCQRNEMTIGRFCLVKIQKCKIQWGSWKNTGTHVCTKVLLSKRERKFPQRMLWQDLSKKFF